MAEKKSKSKVEFTFKEPTKEMIEKQQEKETPFDKIVRENSETGEANKKAKKRGAMTKAESDKKLTSKMTKAELRANQSPSEAKTMLEKKKKMKAGGALKAPANPGLKKLPTKVRNKMGYMKAGGKVGYSKGGIVDRQYLKGR